MPHWHLQSTLLTYARFAKLLSLQPPVCSSSMLQTARPLQSNLSCAPCQAPSSLSALDGIAAAPTLVLHALSGGAASGRMDDGQAGCSLPHWQDTAGVHRRHTVCCHHVNRHLPGQGPPQMPALLLAKPATCIGTRREHITCYLCTAARLAASFLVRNSYQVHCCVQSTQLGSCISAQGLLLPVLQPPLLLWSRSKVCLYTRPHAACRSSQSPCRPCTPASCTVRAAGPLPWPPAMWLPTGCTAGASARCIDLPRPSSAQWLLLTKRLWPSHLLLLLYSTRPAHHKVETTPHKMMRWLLPTTLTQEAH